MRVPAQKNRLQPSVSHSTSPGKRTSRSHSPTRAVRKKRLQSPDPLSTTSPAKQKPGSKSSQIARSTSVPSQAKSTGRQSNTSKKASEPDTESIQPVKSKSKLERKQKPSPSRSQAPKNDVESKKQDNSHNVERRLRSRSRSMERDNKRPSEARAPDGPKSKKTKKALVLKKNAKSKNEGNERKPFESPKRTKKFVEDKRHTEEKKSEAKSVNVKKKNKKESDRQNTASAKNKGCKQNDNVLETQNNTISEEIAKNNTKIKKALKNVGEKKESLDSTEAWDDKKLKTKKQVFDKKTESRKDGSTNLNVLETVKSEVEISETKFSLEQTVEESRKKKGVKKCDKGFPRGKPPRLKENSENNKDTEKTFDVKIPEVSKATEIQEKKKKVSSTINTVKNIAEQEGSTGVVTVSSAPNDDSTNSDEIPLDQLLSKRKKRTCIRENKNPVALEQVLSAETEERSNKSNSSEEKIIFLSENSSINTDVSSIKKEQKMRSEISVTCSKLSPLISGLKEDVKKSSPDRLKVNDKLVSDLSTSLKKEQKCSPEQTKCNTKQSASHTVGCLQKDSLVGSKLSKFGADSKKTQKSPLLDSSSTSVESSPSHVTLDQTAVSSKSSANLKKSNCSKESVSCNRKPCSPSNVSNSNIEQSVSSPERSGRSGDISVNQKDLQENSPEHTSDTLYVSKKHKYLRSLDNSSTKSDYSNLKDIISVPKSGMSPVSECKKDNRSDENVKTSRVLTVNDFKLDKWERESDSDSTTHEGTVKIKEEASNNISTRKEYNKKSSDIRSKNNIKVEDKTKDTETDDSESERSSSPDSLKDELENIHEMEHSDIFYNSDNIRQSRLYALWNGPKRHRMASLNALAKVHVLYENETRIIQPYRRSRSPTKAPAKVKIKKEPLEDSDNTESKDSKDSKPEENVCTRILRSAPGLRGAGRHWDMLAMSTTSSSSTSDDSDNGQKSISPVSKPTPRPPPKQRVKLEAKLRREREKEEEEKEEKLMQKRKRRNQCELMDLKDMVVQKRMASLNASAILAASFEKRSPKSRDEGRLDYDSPLSAEASSSCSRRVVVGDSNDEDEEPFEQEKRKRRRKKMKKKILSKKYVETANDSSSESDVRDASARNIIEVKTSPSSRKGSKNKFVIVDRNIKGVYVNSTRSTHHEGYCNIDGKQFRISSTSRTQTEAKAVPAETVLHVASSSECSSPGSLKTTC